jgi:Putative prokaryotic signal transducing protein
VSNINPDESRPELPKDRGRPVVLRTYRDITEAMVDRTALESAGIQCFLYEDNLIRLDWFVSNAIGGARLVVSENDAADAAKILAEKRPLDE